MVPGRIGDKGMKKKHAGEKLRCRRYFSRLRTSKNVDADLDAATRQHRLQSMSRSEFNCDGVLTPDP